MTTEAALHKALSDLVGDYDGVEDMLPPECLQKILAARAALALPPSESRVEYRVVWEFLGPQGPLPRHALSPNEGAARRTTESLSSASSRYRNVRPESRAVADGPWTPLEVQA